MERSAARTILDGKRRFSLVGMSNPEPPGKPSHHSTLCDLDYVIVVALTRPRMPRTEKGRTQVRDGGVLVIIRLQSGRLIDAPTRRSQSGQAHVQRSGGIYCFLEIPNVT